MKRLLPFGLVLGVFGVPSLACSQVPADDEFLSPVIAHLEERIPSGPIRIEFKGQVGQSLEQIVSGTRGEIGEMEGVLHCSARSACRLSSDVAGVAEIEVLRRDSAGGVVRIRMLTPKGAGRTLVARDEDLYLSRNAGEWRVDRVVLLSES
jgi:hypothetical protein